MKTQKIFLAIILLLTFLTSCTPTEMDQDETSVELATGDGELNVDDDRD